MALRSLAAIAACALLTGSLAGRATGAPLSLQIHVSDDINVADLTPTATSRPDGLFNSNGGQDGGTWALDWQTLLAENFGTNNISGIVANWDITNETSVPQNYVVEFTLAAGPLLPAARAKIEFGAGGFTATGQLLSTNTDTSRPLFSGQIDHSDFATFVDPPFQTSTGFTGLGGGQLTSGVAFSSAGWVEAPGVHESVTMRYDFNLSPGGQALFITGIAVETIPEPRSLTLALVGILTVILVAYRNRVSMQHN